MTLRTARISAADHRRSHVLGGEAFGMGPGGDPPAWPVPGRSDWGVFDGEDLVAQAFRRRYTSWFGGAQIPTCGYAGVTIAAEHRGRGLLQPLLTAVQQEAREAGEVIATLFASAPGLYRRFGFELITSHEVIEVPTESAASVRPGPGVHTRRAGAGDQPAIEQVYRTWARAQNGPLTRTGPSFPATDLSAAFTAVSLACDEDGAVLGYASWNRGPREDSPIEVADLIALTPAAYRALWRMLGSFASVTPAIRLRTSGSDVARLFLPARAWRAVSTNPYMLRVDDVVAAFTLRGVPVPEQVRFAVAGDLLASMDGTYVLHPGEDGAGTCERIGPAGGAPAGTPVYTPGGLALAWAGVQSSANLRLAGGLSGGDGTTDAVLDRALGGWPVHIRDAF